MTSNFRLNAENWRDRKKAIEDLAGSEDHAALGRILIDTIRENHHDLGVLNAALQLLSLLKAPVQLELATLLRDPSAEVRLYAALALGELGDPQSIPALLQALEHPPQGEEDSNVLFNVIEALGKLHSVEAVGPLMSLLQKSDFYLAFPILSALAEIGDPRPAPMILPYLKDKTLSIPAANALGALGDETAIDPLVNWLESEDGDALTAASALAGIARRAGDQQISYSIANRITSLGWLKLTGAAPCEKKSGLREGTGTVYLDLARVLSWKLMGGPKNVPEERAIIRGLICLLNHPKACKVAIDTLVSAGRAASPHLVTRMEESSAEERLLILRILDAIADPETMPVLLALLEDQDNDIVALAADALGRIGNRVLFRPLMALISHPSLWVRRAAVGALIAISEANPIDRDDWTGQLLPFLSHKDPAVRESLALLLARWPINEAWVEQARQALLQGIHDPSPVVRRAALDAIAERQELICPVELEEAVRDEDPGVRAAACRALARCPSDYALPLLRFALSDPDERTRLSACRSLQTHADASSLDALEKVLNDPSPLIRMALAGTLGSIGGPRALSMVKQLAADPHLDVHQAVETALAYLDQEKKD